MQTLNVFGRDIIKKMPILLAAALFMSGFFVAGLVMAAHTAGVTVLPQYVAGGGADNYTFTVTNNGADAVYHIWITVPEGFTDVQSISCPFEWADEFSGGKVKCTWNDPEKTFLASGVSATVSFSAISPSPESNTEYTWNVTTYEGMFANPYTNTEAKTIVDVIAPEIVSITTKDTIGDGKVETATIIFSEPVDDSTFSAGDFKIGEVGEVGEILASEIIQATGEDIDDNTFDIVFSTGIDGTGAKDVVYTAGNGTDIVGNPLANVTTTSVDAAAPVFLSAETKTVNTIDLTFSEDLKGGTVNTSGNEFAVSEHTISGASETGAGVVTLTLSTEMGTGEIPEVTFTSNGLFTDLKDNQAISPTTKTPTDGIAPTLTSAVLTDELTVVLTFGENIDFFANEATTKGKITLKGFTPTGIATADNVATLTFSDDLGTSAIEDNSEDLEIAAEAFKDLAVSANALLQVENQNVSDGVKPTILSISSDTADGSYNEGEVIDIDVTFSENVSSTGDVTITLSTGQTCIFTVTNANSGTCNYSVQANDNSSDLNVSSITGTISDSSDNPMVDFDIPSGTNLADNKNIVIDTIKPLGYSISIDQGDYINDGNKTALSFTFAGAEEGATYNYSIDDTNGGTSAIAGNGTISTASDQIAGIDVSTLDDDTLTLTVYLIDTAGNQGADTMDTVVKDVIAPADYSVSINQGDYINNENKTSLSFTFTGAEVDAVYNYSIDDTNEGTSAVSGDGTILTEADIISLIDVSGLDDDTLTLTVYLTDAAGNQGANTTDTVVKDALVPTVAMTYGANPTKAGDMIITATYSEMIVGTPLINIDQQGTTDIAGVEMTDSGDQIIWNYTYTVQTTNGIEYIDGTATVNLSAVADAAGNNADNPTENTFEIDTTPPSVASYTLDGLATDVYFNPNNEGTAGNVDIVLTASETVDWGYSKVQKIGGGSCAYFPEKADESEKGKLQMTRNWDGFIGSTSTDGEYRIVNVKMTDAAGNVSITAEEDASIIIALEGSHMIVDKMDPNLTGFNSPEANTVYTNTTGVPLTFTATDTNLGTCSYTIGETSFGIDCLGGEIPVANLSEGRNEIVLTVTDLAGNTVSADSVSFVYNGDGILTVDDSGGSDFTTIQGAIDKATINDTISVAAGIYYENVDVNKKLTLQGADKVTTIIDGSGADNDVVSITVDGATLNGFTIQNASGATVAGIKMNGRSGCSVSDIAVKDITGTTYAYGIYGSGMNSNTFSNVTISGLTETGTAMDTGAFGIWLDSSDSNTFSGITVKDNLADSDCQGIMLYNGSDGNSFTDITITNLETAGAEIVYPVGISVWAGGSVCNNNTFTGAAISNIRVTGADGWTAGIQDRGGNTGNVYTNMDISDIQSTKWVYAAAVAGGSKATFNGGNITLVDTTTPLDRLWGVSVWNDGSGAIIDGMTISGAQDGIHIRDAVDAAFSKVCNSAVYDNNVYGINHAGTNTFNAKNNWWGTMDNTTISSKINGAVDYRPWCLGATCAGDEIDQISPTTIISTTAAGDTTNVSPIPFTVAFGESVTTFEAGDIGVTNGAITAESFSGTGATYNFTVTPAGQGTVAIDIAAEVAWDLAGNYNTVADQFSIVYDSEAPSLTPVSIASNNTNGATLAKFGDVITLSFTSSEEIQTPTVTISGHPVSAIDGGSDNWTAVYTMEAGDTEGAVAFTIDFSDTAGNGGQVTAVTSGGSVTFDKTPPAITLTSIAGDDYINDSEKGAVHIVGTAEADSTVNVSLTGGATVSGSGTATGGTYDITIDGTTLTEGTITPSVTATDAAGNVSEAVITPTAIKDVVAPTITSKVPKTDAIGIDTFADITVVFDEDIVISASNVVLKKTSDGIPIDTTVTFDSDTNTATINPPSTLDNNTKYNVALSNIKDTAGNDLAGINWDFTTATSYSISLLDGWNLISLPVTPTNWTSISDVLTSANPSDEVESVWTYNADQGKWYSYSATGGDINAISTMEAGMGYWIKMNGTGTLTGSGTLYEQLVPTGDAPSGNLPQVQLGAGWNMIGYYQLPDEITASIANALSKIDGSWSGSSADIITFEKGTLEVIPSVATMNPGTGYWIFMNKADIYSFGAATPK